MKRIGVLLFCIMTSVVIYGQNVSKHVWQSQDYEDAQKKFDEVENLYKKKGNKTWSQKLLDAFPIASDKTIKHQYVIKCDTTFSADIISNVLSAWCKIKFPDAVQSNIGSNEHFRISGTLRGVGKASGAYGTYINANEEVMIDVKENRVRVTSRIFNYIAGTWKGAEHTAPGDCYPVVPDAKQKDSHAMAFINCHYNGLLTVSNLIKYLNDNISTIKNDDDNW